MNEVYTLNIQRNLEFIFFEGKIGNHVFPMIDIQSVNNNYVEETFGYKNYHFLMKIPYCGKKLHWEIIFDPEDPNEVPDFDFNDDSFKSSNAVIEDFIQEVPEWANWNIKEPQSLIRLLNSLVHLFKKTQVEKLEKGTAYLKHKIEYDELKKTVSEDNIEVYIENCEIGYEIDNVHFLIFIPIDFSVLPEYAQQQIHENVLNDPGEDFAYLQVSFLSNSQTRASLQLSPRAEQILGGKLKFPKYTKDTKLCDYVALLWHLITECTEEVAAQYRMKNEFISNCAVICSKHIIEYDTKSFKKFVFLFEHEDYECMVTINLGAKFPYEKPKIQLSSIYCQEGRYCNQNFTNFAYNPSDTVEEMISKIMDDLKEGVTSFKNHRHI